MGKIDTKDNKNLDKELSYTFPRSEQITIDKANLQIQLDKFKNAIIDTFSFDSFISILITISAVWVPLFTSEFKSVFGLSDIFVKSVYVGFSSIVTFYVVYKYIFKPINLYFFQEDNSSSNSEKMAQIILDKCNKK